jgi:sugar lactone lactonase YvrE
MIKLLLLSAIALAGSAALTAQTLRPLAFFANTGDQYPESIAKDSCGNLYLPLVFGGAVNKVTPHGVVTRFATIPDSFLLGITADDDDNLYVAAETGVWKITRAGVTTKFSEVTDGTTRFGTLNDLTFDGDGNLYVSDDTLNLIWKLDARGRASIWSKDELFNVSNPENFPFEVGCNGLAFSKNEKKLYVTNTSEGRIIVIGVLPNGSAKPGMLLVSSPDLIGIDAIRVGKAGDLYVAQNINPRILRVHKNTGAVTTLVRGGLLSFPTSLIEGPNKNTYYICNNGDSFFSETPVRQGVLTLGIR